MVGASYLTKDALSVKFAEDAGASAVVMPSLFEEQIEHERKALIKEMEEGTETYGEALSYLPEPESLKMGPELYLENIEKIKEAVSIPVFASINACSESGWVEYASMIEKAGADAIELNVYFPPTNYVHGEKSHEDILIDIVKAVNSYVNIPVSVKLSQQFTSPALVCQRLEKEASAKGVVLFNRFFQPDIDIDSLKMMPEISLSNSDELLSRLAWVGIVSENIKGSVGITGGVHSISDGIKSIMAGADAIQLVSSLIKNDMNHIKTLKEGMAKWLDEKGYKNLEDLKGIMSAAKTPNPDAYQRLNYMRLLKSWQDVA
jgi:dihydroorotate dehydrogenase (fumarate)